MTVRELRINENDRWDDYVRTNDYSTPQHLVAWKDIMEDVFDSETHYLFAENAGNITGILPLLHINSLMAGHYVTSVPGGLCADDEESAAELLHRAIDFVKEKNARYLILRDGRRKWAFPGLVTDVEHVTFLIKSSHDLDLIKSMMKRNTRQSVNQATNNGLNTATGFENLEKYYPIYSKVMQDFGNPTMGLGFFKSFSSHFSEMADLITLYNKDQIVGGGFITKLVNTAFCLWSGLPREYYDMRTSYLLNWESIRYARRHGCKYVDLGRCRKDSGVYRFKKSFGGEAQQLYQQFYLNRVDQPPVVGSAMEEELKYRIFVSIWRRLPLSLTEFLGPKLRKQMPFG